MRRPMLRHSISIAFRSSSIKARFARVLALALLAAGLVLPAGAATFEARRGLNLDIWVTWPEERLWHEEDAILPFPEWRRSLDEAGLARLKAGGFDFMRMPVDPSPFLSPAAAAFHDRLYEEVLEAARTVNRAGLKVIVDLHLFPAGTNRSIGMSEVMDDPALFDRYLEVVRRLAATLKREDPAMLALELMNEPVIDCEPGENAWPERLRRLHAAARSQATRLTLVLSGGCWGSAEGLAALDPAAIPDDNVLWSFHSYAPFLLTHQGATWTGDFIPYITGLPFPLHAAGKAELDAALKAIRDRIRAEAPLLRQPGLLAYLDEQVATVDTEEKLEAVMDEPFRIVEDWARRHGIDPGDVLLGEFGMIRQEWQDDHVMSPRSRAAYYRTMIAHAERHGFAWSMWSYGGAFGVVEEFEGRKAEPDVLEMVRGLR
ncbi:glycoside hydrolase family 5 protein [Aquibium microcysteis]|uniref:glycoside hydrolase family 5 protein n=1 Tax=Aquibium microcysteis TaxID=675281 RepID=UPI001EF1F635|nr:cellulase family glycosylhydrolase [Aquibium microcysteis]